MPERRGPTPNFTTQTVFVHGDGHGHMDGDITFGSIFYDPYQHFFPGDLEAYFGIEGADKLWLLTTANP